jgi:hypothetical protein
MEPTVNISLELYNTLTNNFNIAIKEKFRENAELYEYRLLNKDNIIRHLKDEKANLIEILQTYKHSLDEYNYNKDRWWYTFFNEYKYLTSS